MFSEYAPPPSNPRLQYCIEEYVFHELEQRGDTVRGAIAGKRKLDLRVLPDTLRDDLTQSFAVAESVFIVISAIKKAELNISAAADDYRPQLIEVRTIERDVRRIDKEIADLNLTISRIGGVVTEEEGNQARERAANLITQRNLLLTRIPVGWSDVHKQFSSLLKARNDARREYRRKVDDAYQPVADTIATIGDARKLRALENDFRSLASFLESEQVSVVTERVKSVYSALDDVRGAFAMQRLLKDARRSLRAEKPEWDVSREKIALALLSSELAWRDSAGRELLPKLEAYETAIADTIGIRGQLKLPDPVSLGIVKCRSTPRDIYINF